MEHEYDFKTFFKIWADIQKWKIPPIHIRILDFLEDEDWQNDTKALLIWRGIGKSTIVDLWVAFKLSKNPALRFLLLSADHKTAKYSSQHILFITRNHPLCAHLISDQQETRKDCFYVRGNKEERSPSVHALGILSNVTGTRSDYIIYDDVEVQRNSGTEGRRADLRTRLAETAHLLTPEILNEPDMAGRRLFIGTYHDPISIYDEEVDNGASELKIPLIDKPIGSFPNITGISNWPARFGAKKIKATQRTCTGKAEFFSQYLLIPSSIKDAFLDPTLANMYNEEIEVHSANGEVIAKIGHHIIKSVSCFWDPALSKARRDDSVLAVVYTSIAGDVFVHRNYALKGDADEQCKQARTYAKDLSIPLINIESNGIGNYLPQLMLKHLKGTGIGVDGIPSRQNKNEKIIEAFETPLYGGFLYISKQVRDGKLVGQIRDFDPNLTYQKDDYIDATASAIKNEPIRVSAGPATHLGNLVNTGWIGEGTVNIERDRFTF